MLQRRRMRRAAGEEALPSSFPAPGFKGLILHGIRIGQDEEKAGNAGPRRFRDRRGGEHDERIFVPDCEDCRADLGACEKSRDLRQAHRVHASMAGLGLDRVSSLAEHLISTLARCSGGFPRALQAFRKLSQPTVLSWTCLMGGFIDAGDGRGALRLYEQMRGIGAQEPSKYSFALALKACACIGDMDRGRAVHADIGERRGLDSNAFLRSALVSMYGSCGSLADAEAVFARGQIGTGRDVALWSTMLSVYADHGNGRRSMRLLRQMREQGIAPDERCLVIALQACSALLLEAAAAAEEEEEEEAEEAESGAEGPEPEELLSCVSEIGRALHAEARRKEFLSNAFVGSALMRMYAALGSRAEAENAFAQLPCRKAAVLWNAMLSAYVELSLPRQALRFFCRMIASGSSPDGHTYATALRACCALVEQLQADGGAGEPRSLEIGLQLYEACRARGLASDDAVICSNLVALLARCGSIGGASAAFRGFSSGRCDTALWNTMLAVYAEGSQAGKALDLWKASKPALLSEATLVHVLQVGGETGCVSACFEAHCAIASSAYRGSSSSSSSSSSSCSCLRIGNTLVHGYGSCASIADARSALDALPSPDLVSWNALLAGHARDADCPSSFRALEQMALCGIAPDAYSLLSALAASARAGSADAGVAAFARMRLRFAADDEIKLWVCLIDLLARTGNLRRVENVLRGMPAVRAAADAAVWSSSLLRACCTAHADIDPL